MEQSKFELIRDWARERGIYESGDAKTQMVKLVEEQGELAKALLKNDLPKIIDGIGDMVVVLTNLAELVNIEHAFSDQWNEHGSIDIERCIDDAYEEIKNRQGSMKNGTFVKSSK